MPRRAPAHAGVVDGYAPDRHAIDRADLPQRVPGDPDVPTVPAPPAPESPAKAPELARIATHLRRDEPAAQAYERPEGFDVQAIQAAVRGVPGVRDASVRTTPSGAHRLRLDLADGADPAEVSRQVARLLQERMGLAAAPHEPARPVPDSDTRSGQDHGDAAGSRRRRRGTVHRTRPGGATGHVAPLSPDAGTEAVEGGRNEPPPDVNSPLTHHETVPGGVPSTPRVPPGGASPVSPHVPETNHGNGGAAQASSAVQPVASRPLRPNGRPAPRVVINHVQASTFGLETTIEVRLSAGERVASGLATGPAVDNYLPRLAAGAAAAAVDQLLGTAPRVRGRCFVEHAGVVPFGGCNVAVVVVLLVCDGWAEQLSGSAVVAGDPRQAVVRATLAAVNRRLAALLT